MVRRIRPGIVISAAVVLACVLVWLAFTPGASAKLSDGHLFSYAGIALAILSLYGLWVLGKRLPRFRVGIIALAGSLIVSGVVVFVHYLLGIEGAWVELLFDLSRFLFVLSSVVVLWQAIRARSGKSGNA